ncbi:hypothetical protein FACS1894159_01900 [Bacteroidia bacterium]|nr:hypothetical protein FACS1894159_01900 [Bacteroidia bacterium]
MKKIYYLYISIAVMTVVAFFACVKDYEDSHSGKYASNTLSVDEAREFFENQIALQATRGGGRRKTPTLDPGEFTPHWNRAKTSAGNTLASVDVPISAQYRFKALRGQTEKGRAKAYAVDVEQKLVVVKGARNQKMSPYIMTFIPDEAYAAKNRGRIADRFVNSGDRGGYSGVVVYTHPVLGIPVEVNRFVDGKKVDGVFLPGSSREKMRENTAKAKQIVGPVSIARRDVSTITRSGDEDEDWGWDEEWWDWFWDDDWWSDSGDGGSGSGGGGEDYSWFWNWFEQDVFPGLNDGDYLTVGFDNNYGVWIIEDQDGNTWWITEPDGDGYSFYGEGDSYENLSDYGYEYDGGGGNDNNSGNGDDLPFIYGSSLTAQDRENLAEKLAEIPQNILARLKDNPPTIQVNPDMTSPANYNLANNTITVRESDINDGFRILGEECVHALQGQYYDSAHYAANTNIEFEAKLYLDLVSYIEYDPHVVGSGLVGANNYMDYAGIVETFYNNGNGYNWDVLDNNYDTLLQQFDANYPDYSGHQADGFNMDFIKFLFE